MARRTAFRMEHRSCHSDEPRGIRRRRRSLRLIPKTTSIHRCSAIAVWTAQPGWLGWRSRDQCQSRDHRPIGWERRTTTTAVHSCPTAVRSCRTEHLGHRRRHHHPSCRTATLRATESDAPARAAAGQRFVLQMSARRSEQPRIHRHRLGCFHQRSCCCPRSCCCLRPTSIHRYWHILRLHHPMRNHHHCYRHPMADCIGTAMGVRPHKQRALQKQGPANGTRIYDNHFNPAVLRPWNVPFDTNAPLCRLSLSLFQVGTIVNVRSSISCISCIFRVSNWVRRFEGRLL